MEKAYITKRLFARGIDVLIVTLITVLLTMITTPFVNNKGINKLNDELVTSFEKYQKKEISMQTYVNQTNDISYELAKMNGINEVLSIIVVVVYFIVFQVYKNKRK